MVQGRLRTIHFLLFWGMSFYTLLASHENLYASDDTSAVHSIALQVQQDESVEDEEKKGEEEEEA